MARLLVWLVIGFLIAAALRAVTRGVAARHPGSPGTTDRKAGVRRAPPALGPSEPMVACRVCGLNVPRSEALPAPSSASAPVWYCSEAHRRIGLEQR